MKRPFLAILVLIVVIVVGGVAIRNHTVTPTKKATVTPTPAPFATTSSFSMPSGWQEYTNPAGFSFWYPTSWGVDDTELTSFSTLHSAFLNYSNLVTAYSSQTAEADPTQGPSLTMTIASHGDEEAQIKHTFQSSSEWANASSTGLPPGATVDTLNIDGNQGIRIQGLSVIVGKYQVVYLYDSAHNATVRFDYIYDAASDVSLLDSIVQSFSFSKNL